MSTERPVLASSTPSWPVGETGTVLPAPTPIQLRHLNHIAIRVPELEKAEEFYTRFFGMAIIGRAFRRSNGGYEPVPRDYDPDAARLAGKEADVTFLRCEALTFALCRVGRGDILSRNAVLDHLSVDVDARGFAELRAEVLLRNFDLYMLAPEALTFRDPFGVTWEVTLEVDL